MLVILVVAMIGLSFASVPLYRWFCQVTGYGGTFNETYSQKEYADPSPTVPVGQEQTYTVLFDANIDNNLPWDFAPEKRSVTVTNGETVSAFYIATNNSAKPITSTAVFNLTPHKVAAYVEKFECFCFTEQTLMPGETQRMGVVFRVSPHLLGDPNAREVTTITFSYTMFRGDDPAAPAGHTLEDHTHQTDSPSHETEEAEDIMFNNDHNADRADGST